jgi:hypothetical protein
MKIRGPAVFLNQTMAKRMFFDFYWHVFIKTGYKNAQLKINHLHMTTRKKIIIIGIVLILAILSLFIPTIRQGKSLTSSENDRDEVLYEGNTEDSETTKEPETDTHKDK